MNKYILSQTGSKIDFNLNRERQIVIDTIVPIEVSAFEYTVLVQRLGSQIKSVDIGATSKTTSSQPASPIKEKVTGTEEVKTMDAPEKKYPFGRKPKDEETATEEKDKKEENTV
jgi:hypothetical protein